MQNELNDINIELESIKKINIELKSKVENDVPFVKQCKFTQVQQKDDYILKFDELSDFGLKIITNTLACVINNLQTNVVASVSLDFVKKDNKIFLNKLYFSALNKSSNLKQKQMFTNILNYCFGI